MVFSKSTKCAYLFFILLICISSCHSDHNDQLTNEALQVAKNSLVDNFDGFHYAIMDRVEDRGIVDSVAFRQCQKIGDLHEEIEGVLLKCGNDYCPTLDTLILAAQISLKEIALEICQSKWLKDPEATFHELVKFDTLNLVQVDESKYLEEIILIYGSMEETLTFCATQLVGTTPFITVPWIEISSEYDWEDDTLEVIFYSHPIHLFDKQVQVEITDIYDVSESQLFTKVLDDKYFTRLLIDCNNKSKIMIDYDVFHQSFRDPTVSDTTSSNYIWNKSLEHPDQSLF